MDWIEGSFISHYQEEIDFERFKAAGTRFVIAKCSQGAWKGDAYYQRNHDECHRAGVPFGSLHFYDPWHDWEANYDNYMKRRLPGEITDALDVEWSWPRSGRRLTEDVLKFLRRGVAVTGKRWLLYANKHYLDDVLIRSDEIKALADIWLAYPVDRAEPVELEHYDEILLWQYSWTFHADGVKGNVCRSRFMGTRQDFEHFIGKASDVKAWDGMSSEERWSLVRVSLVRQKIINSEGFPLVRTSEIET